MEKRKWRAVRLYVCGEEFNSVLAEEDSASVKSSEATVTQPIVEDLTDKGDIQSVETKEKHNSMSKLFHEEDAAIIIQSAFRRFLVKLYLHICIHNRISGSYNYGTVTLYSHYGT